MTHPLLELQEAHTQADQLRHRRANLPERERVDEASASLRRWERSVALLHDRLAELTRTIEQAERDSADIDTKRDGLQAKLKTVIAPREAEALQHEIATLGERRSALDDVELEALEEQALLDDELEELLGEEEAVREGHAEATARCAAAESEIDDELARIGARLGDLRAEVGDVLLRRYDRLREHHVVAASALAGSRCQGCHLDLSAAEVDQVREAATGGIADCPNCGRLLVL